MLMIKNLVCLRCSLFYCVMKISWMDWILYTSMIHAYDIVETWEVILWLVVYMNRIDLPSACMIYINVVT